MSPEEIRFRMSMINENILISLDGAVTTSSRHLSRLRDSPAVAEALEPIRSAVRRLLDGVKRIVADSPAADRVRATVGRAARTVAARFRPLLVLLSKNSLLSCGVGVFVGLVAGHILFRRYSCPMKPKSMRGVVIVAKGPSSYGALSSSLANCRLEVRSDLVAPRLTSTDQVLVRVTATTLDDADLAIMKREAASSSASSSRAPAVRLGRDLVGVVEEVGLDVDHLNVGDEVWSARRVGDSGCLCEFVVLGSDEVGLRPDRADFVGAATVPYSGLLSLACLKRCRIALSEEGRASASAKMEDDEDSKSVLLVDGTSATGSLVLQILVRRATADVTTCVAYRAAPLARLLGAQHVVRAAPDHADTEEICSAELLPASFDAAIVASTSLNLSEKFCARFVRPGGKVDRSVAPEADSEVQRSSFWPRGDSKDPRPSVNDLDLLRDLVESGELQPVVDRTFSLDAVHDAVAHVLGAEAGVGKTVVTVSESAIAQL